MSAVFFILGRGYSRQGALDTITVGGGGGLSTATTIDMIKNRRRIFNFLEINTSIYSRFCIE